MFKTATLNDYRKAEFISFMKDYLTVLSKHDTTAVSAAVAALQSSYNAITADYQKPLGSDYTKNIEELDKQRDAAYVGIRGVVRAYLNHHEAAQAQAAEALLKSMDKYGKNIQIMNYQAQTVVLENLLVDWDAADLKAALQLLHLQSWATHLKTVNQQFGQLRQDRNEERAAITVEPLDVHRPVLTEAYRKLNTLIAAHQTIAPAENWTVIINEHNAAVEEYQVILARRTATKA